MKKSRRSVKGIVGLALINVGVVLIVNSALDLLDV